MMFSNLKSHICWESPDAFSYPLYTLIFLLYSFKKCLRSILQIFTAHPIHFLQMLLSCINNNIVHTSILGMAIVIDDGNFCRSNTLHINRFNRWPSPRKIYFVLEMRVVVCYGVFTTR